MEAYTVCVISKDGTHVFIQHIYHVISTEMVNFCYFLYQIMSFVVE